MNLKPLEIKPCGDKYAKNEQRKNTQKMKQKELVIGTLLLL